MDKYNEIIHRNINRLLSKASVSENDIINSLSIRIPRQDVIDFFNCKIGCSDRLLIAISKYFKKNVNYFVEEHSDLETVSNSKLENIIKMQNILQLNSVEMAENIDKTLLSLTKQALKKDRISISYASYILNKSVKEIMELNFEYHPSLSDWHTLYKKIIDKASLHIIINVNKTK